MARVFLVHWKESEMSAFVEELEAAGHTVEPFAADGALVWKALAARPPDALVVSMRRLPSHGRQVAAATRAKKVLRTLPVIFFDVKPGDAVRTRAEFPDATLVAWSAVAGLLAAIDAGAAGKR